MVIVESLRLSLDDIHNPGPGFMPFALGISLLLLSLLVFLVPGEKPKEAGWNRDALKRNLLILAGLLIYMLLFKPLGFYLTTFFLLVYLMKLSGEKGLKRSVAISFVTVALIYIVFYRLLVIPFPQGILRI
jgi:putative tricarboxylic transport membrane protein